MLKKRILAIDPGIRNIGIAFFTDGYPSYYGVKSIPHLNSDRKELLFGKRMISNLIDDFSPQILVVEKTFIKNNRSSTLLNTFSKEIASIGRRKKLQIFILAPNTIRKIICGDGLSSKLELAKILISLHPELKPYLSSDRKWKEKHHKNMFDAIAAGLAVCKIIQNL